MIFLGKLSFFHLYVIRPGDSIWVIFDITPRQECHNFKLLNCKLVSCFHLQTREASIETMSVREIEILESILNLVPGIEREGPGNESGT